MSLDEPIWIAQNDEDIPVQKPLARQLFVLWRELKSMPSKPTHAEFKEWEQRLLPLLDQVNPELGTRYKNTVHRVMSYYFGNPIIHYPESFSSWLWDLIDFVENNDPKEMQAGTTGIPAQETVVSHRIFIGHGRSSLWRDLKDFLQDRLKLQWDEFNREPTAGLTTIERLQAMLDQASFAFLVLTAEDEHTDGTLHARENVVHEVGLFQGRLGFRRAILLVEEGCNEFSNIQGLTQIRFPRGDIRAEFEEIRRVLEREGII